MVASPKVLGWGGVGGENGIIYRVEREREEYFSWWDKLEVTTNVRLQPNPPFCSPTIIKSEDYPFF